MDNILRVSPDIPTHLLAYWMGILVGFGIDYRLDPDCPLHRSLRERKRERQMHFKVGRGSLKVESTTSEGVVIWQGKSSPDDTKLKVEVKRA